MYNLPVGALAATGFGTTQLIIGAWVLIMAGLALYQIARRPRKY